jgi:trehalose synthase-fused probable maltokinase
MPTQRWFGAKSRRVVGAEVRDVLWLSTGPQLHALVLVDVTYTGDLGAPPPSERYAIVVGFVEDPSRCQTIANLPWSTRLRVADCTSDAGALFALLRGLASSTPVQGVRGGELVYADATNRARRLVARADGFPSATPVGLEQSNTSVRVGKSHVFKLFRRLEAGENPQLEIERFLAGTTFRAAPPLDGSLTFRASDGFASTLGLLEGWVASEGDGWTHVINELERSAHGSRLDTLAEDMFLLGTITADFHATLASDTTVNAFAPEPLTPADIESWQAALLAHAARVLALVEAACPGWPVETEELGRSFIRLAGEIPKRLTRLDLRPHDTIERIRVHGDYHLGQVLKTPDGFVLIDFEGEPGRSLADRRRKLCPLKDVAGMIRSFQYAAETVHERVGSALDPARAASALRKAFLEGYQTRARTSGARYLPSDPTALSAWVAFFELEKALYEVEYELNNRPAWVRIPLGAVVRELRPSAG